jgi:hypothetical protein
MAIDEKRDVPVPEPDPDESPFELQPIEGLPLTEEERGTIRQIIEQFDRERAAAASRD